MRRYTLIILFLFLYVSAWCGGGEYAVSRIPAALRKNAHAVKRMEKISFEVISTGEAVFKKKYAITILDERGDGLASFVEYYDKLHEIKHVEGNLYDAEGRELKKLRNKQVLDLTGSDDDNLADDNRRKAHHFFYKVYPYTVEYEVEILHNGTLFFPVWVPREVEHLSVEQSSFVLIAPSSYKVRYRSFNYKGEPFAETAEKGRNTLSWEITQLAAIENEYASPDWYEINTVIFTGPTDFEMQHFKGNMETWKDFGKFVYSLKLGRDALPPAVRQTVQQLVSGLDEPKEKVKVLYQYLQKNTRYISIQLGIGGWQPFDAAYVASKAYGDCKALSNYMFSLLKEAGIPSFYTLVKAGRGKGHIIADFPAQQFNHVILCVPFEKDSIWLECTSQTLPAGYLGEFTCDRYALLITEEGGQLVRTPKYGLKENLEMRTIKATLDADATLSLHATTRYSGLQQDRYHDLIHHLSKEKVREVLQQHLDFATYDINRFNYVESTTGLPRIEEELEIVVSNYATITGKRLFIVPNIMTRSNRKLAVDTGRNFEIDLGYEYKDVDSVEISIPAGYTPEAMPKEVSLSTQFGNYHTSLKLSGNKIYYYRTLEHFSGRYPATDYPELVKFYETIYKADRSKLVLVKNETGSPNGF